MTETLFATLKTVALLLFYMTIGYIVGKKKIAGEKAAKTLAAILTFVIMPFYSVFNLSRTVTVDKISLYLELFIGGVAVSAISLIVSFPLSKLFYKKGYSRNIYLYLLLVPNLGYFGYPLVQAVFGDEMLVMYMIFTFPLSVLINTFGYMILTDKNADADAADGATETVSASERRKDMIKRLFSVPMIATFVGLAIGLLPIELPNIAYEFLQPAADCMRAVAMLLAGLVLSQLTVKAMFTSEKSYFISVFRLILLPLIFGGLAYLGYRLGLSKEIFIFTVCLTALPAGLNVVVFPEAIGMSGKEGAQACFISYIGAVVTLPLILAAVIALI